MAPANFCVLVVGWVWVCFGLWVLFGVVWWFLGGGGLMKVLLGCWGFFGTHKERSAGREKTTPSGSFSGNGGDVPKSDPRRHPT